MASRRQQHWTVRCFDRCCEAAPQSCCRAATATTDPQHRHYEPCEAEAEAEVAAAAAAAAAPAGRQDGVAQLADFACTHTQRQTQRQTRTDKHSRTSTKGAYTTQAAGAA